MSSHNSQSFPSPAQGSCAERRLQSELRKIILESPIPYVTVDTEAMGNQLHTWYVNLVGAEGTLYAGEKMRIRMKFTPGYPFDAPEVTFTGDHIPIHPHVYSNGHICLSILGDDWTPALSVIGICLSIMSMLSSCARKELPVNNDNYVQTHKDTSPKDIKWWYHVDTC